MKTTTKSKTYCWNVKNSGQEPVGAFSTLAIVKKSALKDHDGDSGDMVEIYESAYPDPGKCFGERFDEFLIEEMIAEAADAAIKETPSLADVDEIFILSEKSLDAAVKEFQKIAAAWANKYIKASKQSFYEGKVVDSFVIE
jgi:hypothetical protein